VRPWQVRTNSANIALFVLMMGFSAYDLSDVMPAKLHMTVPRSFHRNGEIPSILILQYRVRELIDKVSQESVRHLG
jgi:hypothetical protein